MSNQGSPQEPRRASAHRDEIERLSKLFYIRWTSGPDYERAFICVEDGEPDMNAVAEVGFKQARLFAEAFRIDRATAGA